MQGQPIDILLAPGIRYSVVPTVVYTDKEAFTLVDILLKSKPVSPEVLSSRSISNLFFISRALSVLFNNNIPMAAQDTVHEYMYTLESKELLVDLVFKIDQRYVPLHVAHPDLLIREIVKLRLGQAS